MGCLWRQELAAAAKSAPYPLPPLPSKHAPPPASAKQPRKGGGGFGPNWAPPIPGHGAGQQQRQHYGGGGGGGGGGSMGPPPPRVPGHARRAQVHEEEEDGEEEVHTTTCLSFPQLYHEYPTTCQDRLLLRTNDKRQSQRKSAQTIVFRAAGW